MRGLRGVILAVTMVLTMLGLAGQARAQQGVTNDEILVGAFGPITGPLAYIGLGARSGLELAVSEINENGGINGRKVKLIFETSGTSPAEFLAAARKLVQRDKVFALMIASGSVGAAAAADFIRESGVLTYNLIAATPKIHEPVTKNIFHGTSGPAAVYSNDSLQQMLALTPKPKRVALLVETLSYYKAVADTLKPLMAQAGLELVATEEFGAGDRDFTGQLVSVRRARPDVIMVQGDSAPTAFLIKQAVGSLGMKDIHWVVATSCITPEFTAIGGAAVEGAKSTWLFRQYHGETTGDMAKFEQSWKKLNPNAPAERPNYLDLAAYNGMYVTALAMKNAGKDLTWASAITAFEQLKDATPSKFGPWAADIQAPETFGPNDHQGNDRSHEVVVKSGKWTVDTSRVFVWPGANTTN